MDIKVKREQQLTPAPITSNNTPIPLRTEPTQHSETISPNLSPDHMKLTLLESSSKPSERERDVSTNGRNSQVDMPMVDLRIVKLEKLNDDETAAEANQERFHPGLKDSTALLQQNSVFSDEERSINSRNDGNVLLGNPQGSSSAIIDENGRRLSEDTESFPYCVPIVYPIQSPPIDYQSITREQRLPNPKDYRLERDRSRSPMEHQRQLYEETNWPTESPRDMEVRFDDGNSNSNFTLSSRVSPSQRNSPYSMSSESKEDRTSPKPSIPASSNQNAEKAGTKRRQKESVISADGEKEEESLWKQVERYRYRKRLPLGKLVPTQEETIFMQYNELRERRHREGRITTRNPRPLQNHPPKEPAAAPPSSSPSNHDNEVDADPRQQGSEQTLSPQPSPQYNGTTENIQEHIAPYVNRSRPRVAEVPKSKGLTYMYVTGPSHEPTGSSQCPLPPNTSNPELHPVMFDGNTECRKTATNHDHIENQPIKVHQGYHGYMSPDPHKCHGHESRGIDPRGRPVVRSGAVECRGCLPYDDCCHDNPSYHNHRTFCPTPRYHSNDGYHDNRKRRMQTCGHYCCRRKRMRPTSSDDDDDHAVDNDDSSRWQYSPKEKLRRSETRDNDELYRYNGAQQCSPVSTDDNESEDNGPTSQSFQMENDIPSYENGCLSKENSPRMKEGEEDDVIHSSSLALGDSGREHNDDDVICQVNGLFSLPGYRETKYDITKGELKRRTELPETLTRVEMISYVRQAKTSGRILLDTNGITTSNRSHPTILSRVCERESQVLASGIHKMNLEYLPLKKLVHTCVDMYKSRGCDGCQDCRLKLRRRLVDVEITRNMMKEFHHVIQQASEEGTLDSFELASHTFGTMNIVNHLKMIDEYHKLLLLALDKE